MKPQATTKSANNGGYSIIPPSNFSYVEENICRCCFPLSRANISFVQSINVNYVINLSSKKVDNSFQSYCDEKCIEVNNVLQEGEQPPFIPVLALENWITSVATVIASRSLTGLVLMVGSSDSFFDCLVIACLRRAQEWSFVSILSEFRQFTWPHRMFDFEQVFDAFHPEALKQAPSVKDFFSIHENFKEEEFKLLQRCADSCTTPAAALLVPASLAAPEVSPLSDNEPSLSIASKEREVDSKANCHNPAMRSEAEPTPVSDALVSHVATTALAITEVAPAVLNKEEDEQRRIDLILQKLFFSPKNTILSPGTTYDAALSLINDKDEED